MTIDEIKKIVDELPCDDDPECVIGWLMAQLEHVTTELDKAHFLIHALKTNTIYN